MYILKVPYIGRASLVFKRKITEIVRKAYDVKLCCIFDTCKVKNYFSLKSRSHQYLASNVVYKFVCQRDADQFYLGETTRHIGVRAEEHLDISSDKLTAIGRHIKNCNECNEKLCNGMLSYRNFEVVKSGRSKADIEIIEALLIKKLKPSINTQLFRSGTSVTLSIYA